MENTRISWTHHTHNPWVGCSKVSEACRNCYAADLALTKGLLEDWGRERFGNELVKNTGENPFAGMMKLGGQDIAGEYSAPLWPTSSTRRFRPNGVRIFSN